MARAGEDGRVLAGGQSLVPMLAFRLSRPGVLVDINGLDSELSEIRATGGQLVVGAPSISRSPEWRPGCRRTAASGGSGCSARPLVPIGWTVTRASSHGWPPSERSRPATFTPRRATGATWWAC